MGNVLTWNARRGFLEMARQGPGTGQAHFSMFEMQLHAGGAAGKAWPWTGLGGICVQGGSAGKVERPLGSDRCFHANSHCGTKRDRLWHRIGSLATLRKKTLGGRLTCSTWQGLAWYARGKALHSMYGARSCMVCMWQGLA